MVMIKEFKKNINNSLKEIQQNSDKQLEALQEETQKSLKELQENTTKQAKELNKIIQDLKMEVETIRKSQRKTNLETKNLGKRSGVIDASITNRIQEIEKRDSQVQKIPQKTWTQQSETMQKAKSSEPKENKTKTKKQTNKQKTPGNTGYNEKTNVRDNRYRRE